MKLFETAMAVAIMAAASAVLVMGCEPDKVKSCDKNVQKQGCCKPCENPPVAGDKKCVKMEKRPCKPCEYKKPADACAKGVTPACPPDKSKCCKDMSKCAKPNEKCCKIKDKPACNMPAPKCDKPATDKPTCMPATKPACGCCK